MRNVHLVYISYTIPSTPKKIQCELPALDLDGGRTRVIFRGIAHIQRDMYKI